MTLEELTRKGLSYREAQVATAVIGQSNRAAARELFVGEKTIKFHLTNIFKKLGVKNRWDLEQLLIKDRINPKAQVNGLL